MSAPSVVVQLAKSLAEEVARGAERTPAGTGLRRLLSEHQAALPPGTLPTDAGGGSQFLTIAVPDQARADKLAAALRGVQGVEAAYVKPPEELP